MVRKGLIILAILSVITVILTWMNWESGSSIPKPKSAAELTALADPQLESQVLQDLSYSMYARSGQPDSWKNLPEPARNVWACMVVDGQLREYGIAYTMVQRKEHEQEFAEQPSLDDAREAYKAIGLDDMAALASEIEAWGKRNDISAYLAKPTPKLKEELAKMEARLRKNLESPEAQKKRCDYIRANIDKIARR